VKGEVRLDHNNTNSYIGVAYLPYIKGLSDNLAKILMRAYIKIIFLPLNKLENMFISVKDHLEPLQYKGVYKIMCECGTCYIGEIGRSIHERVKEHYANLQYNRIIKFALAKHVDKTKHHILMDKIEILARCDKFQEQRIVKAI